MSRTSFTRATLALLPMTVATMVLTVACAQKDGGKKIERSRKSALEQVQEKIASAFPFYQKDDAENLKLSAMVQGASAIVDASEDKSVPVQVEVRILLEGIEKEIAGAINDSPEGQDAQLINIEGSPEKFKIITRCVSRKTRCDQLAVLLAEVHDEDKQLVRYTSLFFIRSGKASNTNGTPKAADGKPTNAKSDEAGAVDAKATEAAVVDNAMKLVWTANPKQGTIETGVTYTVEEAKAKRSGVDIDKIKAAKAAQENERKEKERKEKEQKERERKEREQREAEAAAAAAAAQSQQSVQDTATSGASPAGGAGAVVLIGEESQDGAEAEKTTSGRAAGGGI